MNNERFESFLSRSLDNDLSREEFEEFEQYLTSSSEARERYLETADLHNLLDLELQQKTPAQLGISNVVPIDRIISIQRRKSMQITAIATAAALIIGLVGLRLFMVGERPPTLSFNIASSTEYVLTHSRDATDAEGMTMENGSRLQVSKGTVELIFTSGVRSIVTAPADIILRDDDTLFANQGTAWFQVPRNAIGFTVKTKDLTVVDLGTEFGVLAKPDGYDEVHVFKGKVKVIATGHRKESTTLIANEARRNDPIGRLEIIAAKPSAFLKSSCTSMGKGKASHITPFPSTATALMNTRKSSNPQTPSR